MKTTIFFLLLAFGLSAQCDSQNYPFVDITAPCFTLCTPESHSDGAGCDIMVMEAHGADSYTWQAQDGQQATSKTIVFVPTNQTGQVTYTVTGANTYVGGLTCETKTLVIITVLHCEKIVGMPEYFPRTGPVQYYNIFGEHTDPTPGAFLIEHREHERPRKHVILP